MPVQSSHSTNLVRVIAPTQNTLPHSQNLLLDNIANISMSQECLPSIPTNVNTPNKTNELTPEKYLSILKSWAESAPSLEMQKIREGMFDTLLNSLNNKLKSLEICNSPLDSLPLLPPHLEELSLYQTGLTELHSFPPELKCIHIENTKLTKLPELPAKLTCLSLYECPITQLPLLPEGLAQLHCSDTLINQLPECPESLIDITVMYNQLITLSDDVINSLDRHVSVMNNPLSEETIKRIQNLNGQGSTVYYTDNEGECVGARTHKLLAHVARWFPKKQPSSDIKKNLALIPLDENTDAFIKFLNRLEKTKYVTNEPKTKAQVAQWIEQLSHSRQLQEKIFSLAFDATTNCEDRVTLTWNTMKKAVLLQDVEQGNYDNELPTLIKTAREMFRLEKLETIAREKVSSLSYVDEIEVYLAYQTRLHQDLQLDSVAKDMFFFDVSNVKEDDLASATLITKTAENTQFRSWLAQWEPLHNVIKRTAPDLWETAEIDLDEYQQRLDNEIDKISGKNNAALHNDSDLLRVIGQTVHEEMKKETYEPLVDQYFSNYQQSELLTPQWPL